MSWRTMLRLFHTLRHLKAEQFAYRLYYWCAKVRLAERQDYRQRPWLASWSSPALLSSSFRSRDRVAFLGEEGDLTDKDSWNDLRKSKLWLYHLHYLDDLNAVGADGRRDAHRCLINRWIAENPPVSGHGWEPYPLSLRIVNLVKWCSRQALVEPAWVNSVGLQTQALCQQLEFHILGNHLLANAKALVFAGAFLEGDEAGQWLTRGLQILDREIPEQFLPDGGHFERSPMYQAIVLSDICDVLRLAECTGLGELHERIPRWREVVNRGLAWLGTMSHPDGRIALFNDAAFGLAPEPAAVNAYAESLGCHATPQPPEKPFGGRKLLWRWLEQSGYCRVDLPERGVALLDLAPLGPDYLPGHGHADTLSCELSLFGQRVFVNSGISQYGEDGERQRQRGTAAHNTVELDGKNSSDVWSGFRVGQRARPFEREIIEEENGLVVRGAHDGYRSLAGRTIHRREWRIGERSFVVTDRIEGRFHDAVARFHLHPDVAVEGTEQSGWLRLPTGETVMWAVSGARAQVCLSTWHPEFGRSVQTRCLQLHFDGPGCTTVFTW
ncbi:MAG: alginate lyase family protein [Nitrospirae bacterium]|nr:alginate lyase family protein [Nitrospirota bacterium]